MDSLSIIAILFAVAAIIATASMTLLRRRRDKRRNLDEMAVAKAAQDYLAKFGVRARAVATTLAKDRIALMIETLPHKKLRFSYIIEQPIRNFIHVQTGLIVSRVFWRFPIPPNKAKVPEVQYADPTTVPESPPDDARVTAASAPAPVSVVAGREDDFDDYFHNQTYHIEEVSWEAFSTFAPDVEPTDVDKAEPVPEKK